MKTATIIRLGMAAVAAAVVFSGGAVAQGEGVVGHMHEHFDAVIRIQNAVIAGSLEGTREPARWLVEHETPAGVSAGWEKHVEAMRTAAQNVLDADDLEAAATATSRLGLACGGCHAANEVAVEFETANRPSDSDKTRAHMERHQWAADRMWEGLIGPSAVSWSRGGNLLFESPMKPHELGNDEQLVTMSRRIHQLAANATAVRDPTEKADIYAEFLANCAGCHNAVQAGPAR